MGWEHFPHPWDPSSQPAQSWGEQKCSFLLQFQLLLLHFASMDVGTGHKSMSWEPYPAWGGENEEVRRQGWNFPLESCKMQTLRLPNSCTKRRRAEIHFLQRTSHQGIQVQHLPWDTASWKTEEQEKENRSNCFIRGGTFFKAEYESDVIKTQGSSWIERKSPSLHHLAAWI